MNITSRTNTSTAGPTRRLRIIGALAIAAGILAGCSSSGDPGDSGAASDVVGVYEEWGTEESAPAPEGQAAGADVSERVSESEIREDPQALIVTGSLNITVDDPIDAADNAAEIVKDAGGRIDSRDETAGDEDHGGSASLTLRIPQESLDAVVEDLGALGTVDHFTTKSREVSAEVTDLEAKISTLRASTQRIEALLLEAAEIRDIITLEDELAGRQAELEALEARQRGLGDQVALSTIDLSLTTEPIEVEEEEDEPRPNFMDGLSTGWNALVAFFSAVLMLLGVLLPWAVVAAIPVLALIVAVRAQRSRRARRSAAANPPPAVPASAASDPAPAPSGE